MLTDKWKFRFCSLAKEISKWSKDPSSKIGAVIVDDRKVIISTGYNGFPESMDDKESDYLNRELKYQFIIHGEMNALLNALKTGRSVRDCNLFVYGLPVCSYCAKHIAQSGIKYVCMAFESNNERVTRWFETEWHISKNIFEKSNISYEFIVIEGNETWKFL